MQSQRQWADTVVAPATPRGYSGVGVIRITGPESLDILRKVFIPAAPGAVFLPRKAVYGILKDPSSGRVVDDGVALSFKAPHSYTGEDAAEITLHGSPVVLDRAVSVIIAAGARPAGRGEFTRRAFLSGRLDLIQAEAVIDLIEAASPAAADEARSRLGRSVSRSVHSIRHDLTDLLADLVAYVDFDEDDEIDAPNPTPALQRIKTAMDALLERAQLRRYVREGILTVIVGKPNVGKSTLFNALLERDRAIVTPYPGTTRDTLQERLVLEGLHYVLCDTAGLRKAPEPIEEEGVRRAREILREADLTIAVFDGSHEADSEDTSIIEEACRARSAVIVVNKADLPAVFDPGAAFRDLPDETVWSVSATSGLGLDALRRRLLAHGQALIPCDHEEAGLLSLRSAHLLEAAALLVQRLLELQSSGAEIPPDMVIMELQGVLGILGQLTGETVEEDVLDRVFERFCVGK